MECPAGFGSSNDIREEIENFSSAPEEKSPKGASFLEEYGEKIVRFGDKEATVAEALERCPHLKKLGETAMQGAIKAMVVHEEVADEEKVEEKRETQKPVMDKSPLKKLPNAKDETTKVATSPEVQDTSPNTGAVAPPAVLKDLTPRDNKIKSAPIKSEKPLLVKAEKTLGSAPERQANTVKSTAEFTKTESQKHISEVGVVPGTQTQETFTGTGENLVVEPSIAPQESFIAPVGNDANDDPLPQVDFVAPKGDGFRRNFGEDADGNELTFPKSVKEIGERDEIEMPKHDHERSVTEDSREGREFNADRENWVLNDSVGIIFEPLPPRQLGKFEPEVGRVFARLEELLKLEIGMKKSLYLDAPKEKDESYTGTSSDEIQDETEEVGSFLEFLEADFQEGSLTTREDIPNSTLLLPPLEQSLKEAALEIELENGEIEDANFREVFNRLAQKLYEDDFTVDKLVITPEVVSDLIELVREFGYEAPEDAIEEMVSRRGVKFLFDAIYYMQQAHLADRSREFTYPLQPRKKTASLTHFRVIGRLVVNLLQKTSTSPSY